MNIHTTPTFVSMAASATGTACTRVNVADELSKIRNGAWQTQVTAIRAATSKNERNALKKLLSGVIFSGEFTIRKKAGFVRHSGLICADFDNVENPEALRDQIAADPHCVAAWVSPSGTGVKAVFAVDPSRPHGESWRAVNLHCKATFGLEIDPACKDVTRLCFCSWDPDAFIAEGNVSCIEYPAPEAVAAPAASAVPNASVILSPGDDFNERGDVEAILRTHGWTTTDGEEWTRPGKESGVSATLGRLDDMPRGFFCFSSNAAPFEAQKAYPPFAVFTLLECGGDYALASGELLKRGYGTLADNAVADPAFIILPSASGMSITESATKIFGTIATTLTLFTRGRVAHEVITDEHGARLEPVTPRAFRSRLEKHGRLMAWRADRDGKRKLSPAICAEETAGALLATSEARTLLPNIRAIITSPTLALSGPDELVTLEHGWNQQNGGVFVTGHVVPVAVPLPEAVAALSALLDDFDFQSQGDRSRAVAAFITPALKAGGLLNGSSPIEVCEADKSQSGKGFLRKVVSALYSETASIVTQREGGVGSLDEAIASALISGRPFIQLDNLRGKIGSTYLEAILTAEGPVPCREPHRTSVEVDVRPFTFSMTSNGVETTRDLANRCSIVRIKKRPDGYPFRTYPEGGLLEHVQARQPYYLGCVFAVVGEWFMEGCQRTTESRHDFRTWAQSLDWIITHVFGGGPLMEGHTSARDRVSDQGRTWLRAVALALAGENRLDYALTASALAEASGEHDLALPNCRADVADLDRARAVGKVMAKVFADADTVDVDNFTVTRTREYSQTAEKQIAFYRFSQS